jgi:cyclomaltodextrinase
MWAYESVFYQIYPLGLTGAPFENDGVQREGLKKISGWIDHIKKLNVNAVYFSPLFESDTHGYNTRDYRMVDKRLGSNEDLKDLVDKFHENGIKVILDGVFNHVGRGFFAFRDVQKNRENSRYCSWFYLNFDGDSPYHDNFWYEGWEGNYDLLKLNLKNPEVTDYLMDSVRFWIDYFHIDGLRLDVAYMVDRDFLRRLRRETEEMKKDFFLLGEMIGGDYREIMNDQCCHSVTNYECRKGLYSSMNSMNLFEIKSSLERQFGHEPWCLYTGMHPVSFVDNHDVSRIATELTDKNQLKPLYALMYAMPGIPMIYYGSEWGIEGSKSDGDQALRPEIKEPQWNDLTDYIARLGAIRKSCSVLSYGDYRTLLITNRQMIFDRRSDDGRIIFAINIDSNPYHADFNAEAGRAHELITGTDVDFGGGLDIPAYTAMIMQPF